MNKIDNIHKIIGYLTFIADKSNKQIKKRIEKEIIPTIILLSLDAKYMRNKEAE